MTLGPQLDADFLLDYEPVTRTTLHRVYRPRQWSSMPAPLVPSVGRNNRYDCPTGLMPEEQFGVVYFAFDLETCWMEAVVRANMVRPAGTPILVPIERLTGRWACEVTFEQTLRLARFADAPLIDLGDCASNIMADSYLRTHRWSQLLHAHRNPEVDGIHYRSRFRSDRFCVALFDRAVQRQGSVQIANSRRLDPSRSRDLLTIMRRYHIKPET